MAVQSFSHSHSSPFHLLSINIPVSKQLGNSHTEAKASTYHVFAAEKPPPPRASGLLNNAPPPNAGLAPVGGLAPPTNPGLDPVEGLPPRPIK